MGFQMSSIQGRAVWCDPGLVFAADSPDGCCVFDQSEIVYSGSCCSSEQSWPLSYMPSLNLILCGFAFQLVQKTPSRLLVGSRLGLPFTLLYGLSLVTVHITLSLKP